MRMIVAHVGKVDARARKALAHLKVKGINEHLIAQSANHFYQSHGEKSSNKVIVKKIT